MKIQMFQEKVLQKQLIVQTKKLKQLKNKIIIFTFSIALIIQTHILIFFPNQLV